MTNGSLKTPRRKFLKFLESNENKNITYQNLGDIIKAAME